MSERLRDLRRAKGMTQTQVAKKLGVSRRAVSEWETGLRKPHLSLPALSAFYEVTETFLLYGVEPSSVELRELRADVKALAQAISELDSRLMTVLGLVEQLAQLVRQGQEVLAETRRQS